MTPAELRWILLVFGVLFLVALAWWERRRPRQAVGGASTERSAGARESGGEKAQRARAEPTLTLPTVHAREQPPAHEFPIVEAGSARHLATAPGGEAAEGGSATDEDASLASSASAAPGGFDYVPKAERVSQSAAPPHTPMPGAATPRETLPELPAGAAPVVQWPPDDQRRIVAVRLIAPIPERFAGRSLRQALAAEGFVLGRFAIFHKPDEAHRAVLSAASLTRPGTFDADTMDSQHYGGLSLFAVLPGPKPAPQAFDELVFTARSLNERLRGVLQDEQGGPLTPSRVALLRERLSSGATL